MQQGPREYEVRPNMFFVQFYIHFQFQFKASPKQRKNMRILVTVPLVFQYHLPVSIHWKN